MKHQFLIIVQSSVKMPREELVRISIPYNSFTIEDMNGDTVEYDNFRPTTLVNANKEEIRIQNTVQLKVKFDNELVQVFTVRKQNGLPTPN